MKRIYTPPKREAKPPLAPIIEATLKALRADLREALAENGHNPVSIAKMRRDIKFWNSRLVEVNLPESEAQA